MFHPHREPQPLEMVLDASQLAADALGKDMSGFYLLHRLNLESLQEMVGDELEAVRVALQNLVNP
jgi:hypothetical protein